MAENGPRGSARSDERQSGRPVAPPEIGHRHQFTGYDARLDLQACRCGVSMDRFGGLWNADGSRQQLTVECTTETDPGVRSGRERLTC